MSSPGIETGTDPGLSAGDVAGTEAAADFRECREPLRRDRRGVLELAEAAALPALLLGLVVFFALLPQTSEVFATRENARVVLGEAAVLLVVAIAVLIPMVASVWDFSPGALTGMASVFAASVLAEGAPTLVALLVALVVGVVIGLINGVMVVVFRVHSVIATLGMTILIGGLVFWRTEGRSIVNVPDSIISFGAEEFAGIPVVMFVAVAVCAAVYVVLMHTVVGRSLYAIGSNRAAARLIGIRVRLLTLVAFISGGMLAGMAGFLQLLRSGSGNPGIGPDLILPAYAVVFLGATTIRPGSWNVWGVVVAVLFLGVLNSGLSLAGANTYVNSFANGGALLIGILVANGLARRRGRELHIA